MHNHDAFIAIINVQSHILVHYCQVFYRDEARLYLIENKTKQKNQEKNMAAGLGRTRQCRTGPPSRKSLFKCVISIMFRYMVS